MLITLQEVMHTSYTWFETAEILSTVAGCLIVALSLLIFSASCIIVYHQYNSNSTSQLIFIVLMYPAVFVWGIFIILSIGAIFVSAVLDGVCKTDEISRIWTHWDPNDDNTVCQTILEGRECSAPLLCIKILASVRTYKFVIFK